MMRPIRILSAIDSVSLEGAANTWIKTCPAGYSYEVLSIVARQTTAQSLQVVIYGWDADASAYSEMWAIRTITNAQFCGERRIDQEGNILSHREPMWIPAGKSVRVFFPDPTPGTGDGYVAYVIRLWRVS